MIELSFELPLATAELRVEAELPAAVTAVMGPSGAGKTSLLEAIAGLRRKARGRIACHDVVFLDSARHLRLAPERRRVGYVPQDAGLFPHLTALGNVRFGARAGTRQAETAIETLEIGPLLARYPASLSGGEKQRVALARALATAPRMLLLDEPLAALDVELKERVLPYLMRIRDEWKVPILYVTHNVGEALALAGHVLFLRAGRVEAQGAPLDLLSSPGLSAEAEAGIENLLRGRVAAHDPAGGITRIELDGKLALSVPLAESRPAGSAVTVAIRAEDVLVSTAPVKGLSARNVYEARVEGLERTGVDVTLRCAITGSGRPWLVRVTPAAVEALGLAVGTTVWLAVKSHSVRIV
ncbi:MAG: molybdenum ABC transporter ATP-binding protein [Acidobacteria bacterium]|nr:MAG: molybdenum ABC transporter ATP-binding protein [Acidobacteriota bacterium]